MAGGAGLYEVDGVGAGGKFVTIAAAVVQLIADEDGTETTAEQIIELQTDTTEADVTLPTLAQVKSSSKYPLTFRGDSPSTLRTWTTNSGNVCSDANGLVMGYMQFKDMILAESSSSDLLELRGNRNGRGVYLENIEANTTASLIRGNGSNTMRSTKIHNITVNVARLINGLTSPYLITLSVSDSNITCSSNLAAGVGALHMERCRVRVAGDMIPAYGCGLTMIDTTVDFSTTGYLVSKADSTHQNYSQPYWIRNCIINNAQGRYENTNADAAPLAVFSTILDGNNIWSNKQAGNFYECNGSDHATLSAFQSATGGETGSVQENVTFTSTTWNSADFLKLSADTTQKYEESGIATDVFGTSRVKNGAVNPGAHQYTAAPEDVVTTCTPPATPTITVADDGDADNVTVTVTGSDSGTINKFYWVKVGETTVNTESDTVTGDGTISASIADTGTFFGWVQSNNQTAPDPCVSVSNVLEFMVAGVGGTVSGGPCDIGGSNNVTYTIERATESASSLGAKVPTWASAGTISLWLQDIGSGLQIEYEKRGISVTYKAFTCTDPGVQEGDRLVSGGRTLVVQGVIDQAGMGRVWRIDLDELL